MLTHNTHTQDGDL